MRPHVGRRWVLCLCVLLLATTAAVASAQSGGKEYAPTEGQPGKDVIWLPSRETVVDKMLGLAKVTPQDYLIDLGSGDGRLVIAAAKRGARALGIEYNPDLVELSKRNAATEGVAGATQFVKADIFESDFSQASVITLFLLPEAQPQAPSAASPAQARHPGCVQYVSDADWTPDEHGGGGGGVRHVLHRFSLDRAGGRGAGEVEASGGQLMLSQNFQMVGGTVGLEGKRVPIGPRAVVRGSHRLTAGDVSIPVECGATSCRGTFKSPRSTGAWSAVRVDAR